MSELKKDVNCSVFAALFGEPENAAQLYRSLHPEDTQTAAADCKIIALDTIFASGVYNNMVLLVRDKVIVLLETRFTFSANIVLQMLENLAAAYQGHITEHKISLYSGKAAVPRPEFYVIFTGQEKNTPKKLRLSDLYGGKGCAEVEANVVTDGGGILGQYVAFCKISDEQRKLHGSSEETAREIVRICLERNILAPFLESKQKEVIDMMDMLFAQEEVDTVELYNARQEGLREGWQEGRQEGARSRDKLYAALWEKLSPLGRISEFPEAMASEEKLRALAVEFGLDL